MEEGDGVEEGDEVEERDGVEGSKEPQERRRSHKKGGAAMTE